MKNCYQVHASDNVATMLEDSSSEPIVVLGASDRKLITLKGPTLLGHKVALTAIESGASVIKYGVTIGVSTHTIFPGEWVHLHNCRSRVDERSSTLDVETGATT